MNLPSPSDLPHNFEAEQAVLGAILFNNAAFNGVSELLRVEHFADPMHGAIYDATAKLLNRGQAVNAFSLKAYVQSLPGFEDGSGTAYLAKLVTASVHPSDVPSMARVVRDAALRRSLVAIGHEAMTEACSPQPDDTAADQIGRLEKRLYDLAEGNTEGGFAVLARGLERAVVQADRAHKRRGKLSGVTTGLASVDRLLGGLQRSDLVILAGRPGMGKTALATNIATAAATAFRAEDTPAGPVTVDGARVGFISLEMSAEQLATRIVAERAEIPGDKIRKGELSAAQFDRLLAAAQDVEAMPLFIDDTPALTIGALRTRARRLKRQHGVDLLVVDYLQLIRADERRRNDNRVQEVSEVTMGLKAIAKELDVPVLALSQLSRGVEGRQDKRPQLSDLRDSGSIEQDADVVMFVFREEYYRAQKGDDPGDSKDRAEVIVEKNRHGPTGLLKLKFEAWLTRFSDLEAA
jgi:replicative DNA helicase